MRPTISIILVLGTIILGLKQINADNRGPISTGSIDDAIMSLIQSYSQLDNKLDRHEQRERALAEVIKKSLMTLQKGQRSFEPLIRRLEERVGQIETILLTQEEKVNEQQQKLGEALESVLKWMMENTGTSNSNKKASLPDSSEEDNGLTKKIDELTENIKSLRKEIIDIKTDNDLKEETAKSLLIQTEKLLSSKIASSDEVITKLEDKLSQFYITSPVTDSHSEEWEKKVENVLNDIKINMNNVKATQQPPSKVEVSFDKSYFDGLNNNTLNAIEDMKLEILTASDKSFAKTSTRIKETNDALENSINEVIKSVSDAGSETEIILGEIKKSNAVIIEDIAGLGRLDKVLLEAAEHISDTKKRLEFGIHQIILEVGEGVRMSASDVNATILKRLNEIQETIISNHDGALSNLTAKIETEMGQVWRQIGIMYQEISLSKQTLDKLQQHTEVYVNGTLSTMDGMEGQVSQITERMVEIESNLNFLLGRLSLVTQEFNSIKTGLGAALDDIKTSFELVQKNIKVVGPGPHLIPEEEKTNNLFDRESKPSSYRMMETRRTKK